MRRPAPLHPRQARLVGVLVFTFLLMGCAHENANYQANSVVDGVLLIQGAVRPELRLDPVLHIPGTPSVVDAEGANVMRGFDSQGHVLFESRFEAVPVSVGDERHFSVAVSAAGVPLERLAVVQVMDADGSTVRRTARLSLAAVAEALERGEAVTVQRTGADHVTLRFDPDRYPLIMVLDPETGHVLALARQGSVTLPTRADALMVVVSEGVHSARRLVPVDAVPADGNDR
jgi:hypothetical protein